MDSIEALLDASYVVATATMIGQRVTTDGRKTSPDK